MSGAKARLEEELSKLESLLRLLDDFEHDPSDQQLLVVLSQKLKVIVPELRALSLDPAYKTPECAPLLVTLGQGVKNAVLRTRGLSLPPASEEEGGGVVRAVAGGGAGGGGGGSASAVAAANAGDNNSSSATAPGRRFSVGGPIVSDGARSSPRVIATPGSAPAEPKPLKGYLRKRGEKGLVKGYKLRYFEQRGDKVMYYVSDRSEDLKSVIGWIDLGKMISVERNGEPRGFDVKTIGRVYTLQVPAPPAGSRESTRLTAELDAAVDYWIGGLLRWKQYRQEAIARMNRPPAATAPSHNTAYSGSPRSSAWQGLSVLSDDEESVTSRPVSMAPSELSEIQASQQASIVEEAPDSPVGPVTAHPELLTSFEMSPDGPPDTRERSTSSLRQQLARSSTGANRRLNFEEVPSAVVAAVPQQPQQDHLEAPAEEEVKRLRTALANERTTACEKQNELLSRLAEAANAAANRSDELETLRAQVKVRDGLLQREEERRLELEAQLREATSRRGVLEADLRAANAELANRELVIAQIRSQGAAQQALTGDVGRLMGTAGRQSDAVQMMARELEHEREANEAHQLRVRFLASQLAELERHSKAEIELRDANCDALRGTVARLRQGHFDGVGGASSKLINDLKREYFQALGVGMKLNLALQGQTVNVNLASLYEEVVDVMPYTDWNRFLSLKLSLELNPKQRQAILAELTALVRNAKK